VKRRAHSNTGTGHVDIAIVSPDGENLEEISTHYTPRNFPARLIRKRRSCFYMSMSTVPLAGSVVRVAYHGDSRPYSKTFSCGGKRAASEAGL